MDHQTIKESIDILLESQSEINGLIDQLRDKCDHPQLEGKYDSNTGNWDGFDYYWWSGHCAICGEYLRYDKDDHYEQYRSVSKRLVKD